METFSPAINPSTNSKKAIKCRVKSNKFGDGYNQTAPDGLNNVWEEWDLTFEGLTNSQAQDIEDFFVARQGTEPFLYTPPDAVSPKQFKFVEDSYDLSFPSDNFRTVSLKIIQDFTL